MTDALAPSEKRIVDLMAKMGRLELEVISLAGEMKQAVADWLAEIRRPLPETKPRMLTVNGIADEFFRDAYPDTNKRRKAARRFCEKHRLISTDTPNARGTILIDANKVASLLKGGE